MGRQSAMSDATTELTFAERTEARMAPGDVGASWGPGAAGAAALRKMLLPDLDEPGTPRFDRSPTFDQPKQPPTATLPKSGASNGDGNGSGRQVWPDGASYDGQYKCGLKHGMGRFSWASGASYEGDFVEDRLEGSGYFRWACGSTYEGAWKDGRMHGFGLFTWPDGRSYEGEYHHDFKDGQGIFRWPDGRQYDGQWKDGVQHGSGMFTSAHGKCKKTEWREGQLVRSGRGGA